MTQKRKSYARRGQNYEEDYFDLGIEEVLDLPRLTAEDDQALSEAEKIALKGSNFQTRAFKKILNGEVVMMIDDYTDAVYVIQHALIQLGYGHMLYDEYADHYGEGTAQAIFAFQFDHDALAPSGMVNAETLKVIDEKLSALETEPVTETEERIEANHERIDPDWEAKKAKWAKMGPAQIAKDRGLDWKQVKDIMRSDGTARVNGYIKELLMEGWIPEDGAPEVRTTRENGVMVIEAWTFSLAVQTAIANGLGWDKGDMFRWKQHRNAKTNQLIELYTQPRPLDVALDLARNFVVPFKGSVQEFVKKHEGSFLVYQNNVSDQIPAPSVTISGPNQDNVKGEKVFTKLENPSVALVQIRQTSEGDQGIPLYKNPISVEEAGSNEIQRKAIEKDIITHLPFNTKLTILEECKEHDWYYVMTEKNDKGYVEGFKIKKDLPDPSYRYHYVEEDQNMLEIAHMYYNPDSKKSLGQIEEDPLYRNYVLELGRLNLEASKDGKSGVYVKGGGDLSNRENWENIRVKKNHRIWVADSNAIYTRLLMRSEKEIYKYDGVKANVFKAGQVFLDHTAQTFAIKSFLGWWDKIPEQERIDNIKEYGPQIVSKIKLLRNDSEIGRMIEKAMVLIPGATTILMVRRLLVSTVVGFFDTLVNMDPKVLIKVIGDSLRKLLDIQFYIGLGRGIIRGVVQWGEDLLNIFTDVGKLMGTLLSPEFYNKLSETGKRALEYVTQKKEKIMESFKELSFIELFSSLMDGAMSLVNMFGEKLGGKLAIGAVNYINRSPFGFGNGIGKIGGMLLPDIVIGALSGGVWAAVKGAITGSQYIMKILKPILKGIQVVQKTLQRGKNAVKGMLKMIKNLLSGIFKSVGQGAKRFWQKLEDLFGDFMRFFSKKADNVPGGKKAGIDTDVDDFVFKNKKKYEGELKGKDGLKDHPDSKDYDEKMRALLWAKAYVEMEDKRPDTPSVQKVVGFLNLSIKYPGGKQFQFKPLAQKDTYRIFINPTVGNLTVDDFEESFPNQMKDDLPEELADAERLGVRPTRVDDIDEFDRLVNDPETMGELKWVVLEDGSFVVMPKYKQGIELKHPVLSGGKNVKAAGEMNIAGSKDMGYYLLEFNNHSGHFKPTAGTEKIARDILGTIIKLH